MCNLSPYYLYLLHKSRLILLLHLYEWAAIKQWFILLCGFQAGCQFFFSGSPLSWVKVRVPILLQTPTLNTNDLFHTRHRHCTQMTFLPHKTLTLHTNDLSSTQDTDTACKWPFFHTRHRHCTQMTFLPHKTPTLHKMTFLPHKTLTQMTFLPHKTLTLHTNDLSSTQDTNTAHKWPFFHTRHRHCTQMTFLSHKTPTLHTNDLSCTQDINTVQKQPVYLPHDDQTIRTTRHQAFMIIVQKAL